jgi:uncharacterized alpha-E superfamily protein
MLSLTGEKTAPLHLDAFAITRKLGFDRDNDNSLINSLGLARDNARQVREALSNEVWENLNRLYLRLAPVTMDSIWVHTPARLFREALEEMHALEGVTYSTLSHGEGWYFLELGRHIERVQQLGRLLDIHFTAAQSENGPKYFDWLVLLKFCTAFEPYTKRYTASIRPQKIAEFLLFDSEFPHSICFSVDRMTEALARVGGFATNLRITEFLDWYARALEAGLRMTMLPELVAWRRIHGENQSMRDSADLLEYPRVLKAALKRRQARRAANPGSA